ncbi:MAG: transposase [Gemmatimonadota bacterium]
MTDAAGLVVFRRLWDHLGVGSWLDREASAVGGWYRPSLMVEVWVALLLYGGERLDDLDLLRSRAVARLFGWVSVPDATTFGRWLRRGGAALAVVLDVDLTRNSNPVQRCRAHKVRNVSERLPKEKRGDVKKAMRAAFRLEADEGIARLATLALWLERDHYPDAAASLREGLDEMFTLQRLGLPSALTRCLATTNIIESPQGGVRARSGRVTHWRDPEMILRWCGAAFLECEKRFRRIDGYQHLWVLEGKLREIQQRRESPDRAA